MAPTTRQEPPPPHSSVTLYNIWKRDGNHLAEYLCELGGTLILVFAVVGFVALWFAASSPTHALTATVHWRLLFAGTCIGMTGTLFTISPPGKLSGAHLNPMMSLGFLMLGKMHARDFWCYVAAQLFGGLLGALAAIHLFGAPACQVHEAVLGPGPRVSVAGCFWAEWATSAAYCYFMFSCLSVKRTARFTPWLNVILAALLVCVDGNVSGAGFNPARWFGPAAGTNTWALGWIYTLGPLLGAAAAVGLRNLLPLGGSPVPHTGKISHDTTKRSIFKGDTLPTKLPSAVSRQGAGG